MKIGLVLPDPPQYSETFFYYKIRGLQKSGFKVVVFGARSSKKNFFFKYAGAYPVSNKFSLRQLFLFFAILLITFIRFPKRTYRLISMEKKEGNSFVQSLKTVYVNAHIIPHDLDWIHFGFATMTIKHENIARAIGAKMGVSFRGYDINIYPLKNPQCYKKLWPKIDKIHTISDYLHRKALKLGLSNEIPCEKITPAVNTSLFKVKDNLGSFNKPLKILSVGRLNWIKNYETAISVMKILDERGADFIYNIIGTGKDMERLRFAVNQSDLEKRVFFLGQIDHEGITEWMHASDIYLQTSYQEGFCVSALEAQASGLLCIVSDADGLKENVVDGETGWVVSKRDPEAFADKITEVINLPFETRKTVAINARKRVEKNFNVEDQEKKFIKFFTE